MQQLFKIRFQLLSHTTSEVTQFFTTAHGSETRSFASALCCEPAVYEISRKQERALEERALDASLHFHNERPASCSRRKDGEWHFVLLSQFGTCITYGLTQHGQRI